MSLTVMNYAMKSLLNYKLVTKSFKLRKVHKFNTDVLQNKIICEVTSKF